MVIVCEAARGPVQLAGAVVEYHARILAALVVSEFADFCHGTGLLVDGAQHSTVGETGVAPHAIQGAVRIHSNGREPAVDRCDVGKFACLQIDAAQYTCAVVAVVGRDSIHRGRGVVICHTQGVGFGRRRVSRGFYDSPGLYIHLVECVADIEISRRAVDIVQVTVDICGTAGDQTSRLCTRAGGQSPGIVCGAKRVYAHFGSLTPLDALLQRAVEQRRRQGLPPWGSQPPVRSCTQPRLLPQLSQTM